MSIENNILNLADKKLKYVRICENLFAITNYYAYKHEIDELLESGLYDNVDIDPPIELGEKTNYVIWDTEEGRLYKYSPEVEIYLSQLKK